MGTKNRNSKITQSPAVLRVRSGCATGCRGRKRHGSGSGGPGVWAPVRRAGRQSPSARRCYASCRHGKGTADVAGLGQVEPLGSDRRPCDISDQTLELLALLVPGRNASGIPVCRIRSGGGTQTRPPGCSSRKQMIPLPIYPGTPVGFRQKRTGSVPIDDIDGET